MLDRDFNELDNDYITLWSRMYLNWPSEYVQPYLDCLAELGQPNALAAYYVYKQATNQFDKVNPTIDSITRRKLEKIADLEKQDRKELISIDDAYFRFTVSETAMKSGDDENTRMLYADFLNRHKKYISQYPSEQTVKLLQLEPIFNTYFARSLFDYLKRFKRLEKDEFRSNVTYAKHAQHVINLLRQYYRLIKTASNGMFTVNEKRLRKLIESQYMRDSDNPVWSYLLSRNIDLMGSKNLILQTTMLQNFSDLACRSLSQTLISKVESADSKNINREEKAISQPMNAEETVAGSEGGGGEIVARPEDAEGNVSVQ